MSSHALSVGARGVLGILSILLVIAGSLKLRRPGSLSALLSEAALPHPGLLALGLGAGEVVLGICGIALPAHVGGALVALMFGVLSVGAAAVGRRAPGRDCGCFGVAGAPLGWWHVALNGAAAAVAGAVTLVDPSQPGSALGAVALLVAQLLLALALRSLLAGDVQRFDRSVVRLAESSARLLDARLSRRSLLTRMAVGGSAFALAPLRYLLYPGSAMAVIVPTACNTGLCSDGYTAFCCELNKDQTNVCPADTFVGGWWVCTDYRGHQLCHGSGVRYYIDCNALPGRPFPGGCRCANDSCDHRRQACNVFRYGQCNTHIAGTTAVVCRMVTCENPGRIAGLGCSTAVMVDNAVCGHEAPCLEPLAVQLSGVGGA
ncbi:MAG: MauE/DoxX family redox-associated membrane protein [Solirubrobacteraceae bacterium]